MPIAYLPARLFRKERIFPKLKYFFISFNLIRTVSQAGLRIRVEIFRIKVQPNKFYLYLFSLNRDV